ncbi:hypothetical protein L596_002875 [Steinernema carpocapsae]|uniref:Uncharacterized protein n=1 Tax=Steinernema carpocapsae TaxID=34508 RepID=A0A4U8USD9_STECR|nr:hypothetical protein L596_002875 [Steinernema carpocapsae]
MTYNWNWMKALPVRGLDATVDDVIRYFDDNNCLYLPWGAAIRDALIGVEPVNIEGEISCSLDRLFDLCEKKFSSRECFQSSLSESAQLTIGSSLDSDNTNHKVAETMEFSAWFSSNSKQWEFTANNLALYDDQAGNVYIVDVSGRGRQDACRRKLFFTSDRNATDEWWEDDFEKIMQAYKMRLDGFSCGNSYVCDFIRMHVRRLTSHQNLEEFYCADILDGTGIRSESGDYSCYLRKTQNRTALRRHKFDEICRKDFGEEYWRETLGKVEEKTRIFDFYQIPSRIVEKTENPASSENASKAKSQTVNLENAAFTANFYFVTVCVEIVLITFY